MHPPTTLGAQAPPRRSDPLAELGRLAFYPVFAGARFVLLVWLFVTFGPGYPPAFLPFLISSFALLALAELWIPYRRDWSLRGDPQWKNDLGHSVAYLFNNGPVVRGLVIGTAIAVLGSGEARLWRGVWPDAWPVLLQIVLVIALDDALEYWVHRLGHTRARLWPFHVLHHTPDRVHVLKTLRHHFGFAWIRAGVVSVPILALGAPLEMLAWGPVALFIFGPLSHANVDVRLPAWSHRVVNTPQLHRVHHSIEPDAQRSNFCFAFPVWDILFGTFRAPEHEPVAATGLQDDPVPPGFWKQILLPFTRPGASSARGYSGSA